MRKKRISNIVVPQLFTNGLSITKECIPTVGFFYGISPLKKYSKYRAVKIEDWDGLEFDSLSEWKRWRFLLLRQEKGQISRLERQVEFDLSENLTYVADFTYYKNTGEFVVEDVKSPRLKLTNRWRNICYLMYSVYNIQINIVHPSRLMVFNV